MTPMKAPAAPMTPTSLHAAMARARTVHGASVLSSPDGPVAVVTFRAMAELAQTHRVLALLDDLGVPAVAIATDGAADLAAVHEIAAVVAAPVLSDPFGSLRAQLMLRGGSAVHLVADQGGAVRFDLHRATRRSLFAVLFDAAWRAAPAAAPAAAK